MQLHNKTNAFSFCSKFWLNGREPFKIHSKMAYESNNRQRRNHHHHQQVYEWSPSNDYQEYGYEAIQEPEVRRSYYEYNPQVGFKSNNEEASSLAETGRALDRLRHSSHNGNEKVDEEAETFIQLEHRRIYLTKLMSTGTSSS